MLPDLKKFLQEELLQPHYCHSRLLYNNHPSTSNFIESPDYKLVKCLATKAALIFGSPVESFRKNLESVKDNNNSHISP